MAQVRPVTPADEPALCALLSAFPWEGMTAAMSWPDRLRHWWADNPACDDAWVRGWVVDDGGKLAGFFGSVPRRVAFEGKVVLSANATTWWVAPEHRKLSLQLLARFTGQKAHGHFNNTGSGTTNELMEAFGYRPYPGEDWSRESLVIVDPARLAAEKLKQRAGHLPGVAAIAALAGAAAPLGASLQTRRLPAAGAHRWERLTRADQRFDGLAAALRARHGFTAERDRASLDWWLRGEAADRKVLVACLRGGTLAGLALLLERPSGTLAELPILDCFDLATDREDPEVVTALVAGIAQVAREREVPLAVLRHFDGFLARCYAALGLPSRNGPPRRDVAKLPPIGEPRGYYLTQFHGDFFI
jgi:hypothetical protein